MDDLFGKRLGNYKIERLISQGGFARVYLGLHIHTETEAAIKVLKKEVSSEDQKEFVQEAKRCMKLKHDHILQVLDFGIEDNKILYLVMHYAPKGTLRSLYPPGSRVPLSDIESYVQQIASALQYVHTRKHPLIHRDVKPANMLVGEEDEIMLSDFGIAIMAPHTNMIAGQKIGGTPPYMAPEQFRGEPCLASDQYALAIVVYEWLCGFLPFTSSDPDGNKRMLQLAKLHVEAPPPSLQEKGVAERVEQVVFKALAKKPSDRYPTVQEFAKALALAVQQAEIEEKTQPRSAAPPGFTKPPSPFPSTQYDVVLPTEPVRSLPLPSTIISFRVYSDYFGEITCLVPSPDGKYIASASTNNAVYIWDVASRLTVCTFRQHKDRVTSLAWSPDGKRVVSLSRDNVVLEWNVLADTGIIHLDGYPGLAAAITWQSKALCIAAVTDNAIEIWDAVTKKIVAPPCTGHTRQPQAIAWSPDGCTIAFADGSSVIHMWDVVNGRHLKSLSGPEGGMAALAWSPRSERLAATCGDKTVRVWDIRSGQQLCVNRDHALWAAALAWSPEGSRLASAGRDSAVLVWDMQTDQNVCAYLAHHGEVTALAWPQAQQAIVSAGKGGGVQIWDVPVQANLLTYRQHKAAVSALAFSPYGDRAVSAI